MKHNTIQNAVSSIAPVSPRIVAATIPAIDGLAGAGSAAMVHTTAKVDVPAKQALYGIIEVFFDPFVICTFTALIIPVNGVWNSGVTDGTQLASMAFAQNPGRLGNVVMVVRLLFCLFIILGWVYLW